MADEVHIYKRTMELGDEAIEQYVLHPRTNGKLESPQNFYSEDEEHFVEEFLKYQKQAKLDIDNKPLLKLSVPDEVQEDDNTGAEWYNEKIGAKEFYGLVKAKTVNKVHVYKKIDLREDKTAYYLIHQRKNGKLENPKLFKADRDEGHFVKTYKKYPSDLLDLSVPSEVPSMEKDSIFETTWYYDNMDKKELEDIIKASSFK